MYQILIGGIQGAHGRLEASLLFILIIVKRAKHGFLARISVLTKKYHQPYIINLSFHSNSRRLRCREIPTRFVLSAAVCHQAHQTQSPNAAVRVIFHGSFTVHYTSALGPCFPPAQIQPHLLFFTLHIIMSRSTPVTCWL